MFKKPICYEPQREIPEIFPGVPTFLGLPAITLKEEIQEYDIITMGAPWEGACTWGSYTGCELATKSIRQASIRYSGFLPEMGFDIFDNLKGADYGDAPIHPGNIKKTLENIHKKASEIIERGAIPLVFGGDHSISTPVVEALSENTDGKVGVVHIDAHLDNMDSFGEEKNARCSPLHRIYEIENVDPHNVFHMAIRGPRNNPEQLEITKEMGASILTSFDIKLKGIEYAVSRALKVAREDTDAVYVTVCSDALDVSTNPGGPPDFNGLTSFEMSLLLHRIASAGINGFDFVEIYPPSDLNEISSHLAVWMTLYALSGITCSKMGYDSL
jgi:agmatinase